MKFQTFHNDFSNLYLSDGTRADKLRLRELKAELTRLCIPGITPEMGKDALLRRYGEHVAATAETLPQARGIHRHALSLTAAQHAAKVIDRQAAGFDSAPAPPSLPPIARM